MTKRVLNNKIKKEIEFALNAYLERRLIVSCDLLNEKLKDSMVSLDNYVSKLKEVNNILNSLREDGTRSKAKNQYEEKINLNRVNLINEVCYQVVPSRENIKEILDLVRYFLNNYSLPTNDTFNETLFLQYIMGKLRHDKWGEVREKALKYLTYFSINKYSCFCVSGSISFGNGSMMLITNQDDKVIFQIDEDKRIVVPYCPFDDYILFGDNIVLASFENSELVPLRQVDGYYHDFFRTGKLYQDGYPSRENYIEIVKSLKEYLEESGLHYFYKKVLTLKEMKTIINLINYSDDFGASKSRIVSPKQNNGN